jgi:hypothetical protein
MDKMTTQEILDQALSQTANKRDPAAIWNMVESTWQAAREDYSVPSLKALENAFNKRFIQPLKAR